MASKAFPAATDRQDCAGLRERARLPAGCCYCVRNLSGRIYGPSGIFSCQCRRSRSGHWTIHDMGLQRGQLPHFRRCAGQADSSSGFARSGRISVCLILQRLAAEALLCHDGTAAGICGEATEKGPHNLRI